MLFTSRRYNNLLKKYSTKRFVENVDISKKDCKMDNKTNDQNSLNDDIKTIKIKSFARFNVCAEELNNTLKYLLKSEITFSVFKNFNFM